MPPKIFVPPAPYRPGHAQNDQATRAPNPPQATYAPIPRRIPINPKHIPAATYAQPTRADRAPVARAQPRVRAPINLDLETSTPVASHKRGLSFAQGCLVAAATFAILGGAGVGGWQLAEYIKHHKSSDNTSSTSNTTGDINNNTFGPLVGSTNTSAPVNGTTAISRTNGTVSAAPPFVYVAPIPCPVSFVGTAGGNITGCTTSLLASLTNPYTEPRAVDGALYQPIALTPINLYPTGNVPSFYDVVEHHMDVCYEAASFAALAARQGGPNAIFQALVQTSSGAVPTYNISMYTPRPDFAPINVSVSGLQMTKSNSEVLETSETHDISATNPLGNWATFFEKAFAKYNDVYRPGVTGALGAGLMGYNGIGAGGSPGDVIEAFLGRPASFFDVASNATLVPDALAQFIANKNQAGDVVTFLTNGASNFTAGNSAAGLQSAPFKCTTIASHTYVALGVDIASRTAILHNVWGTNPCFTAKGQSTYETNGTVVASIDDVKRLFMQAVFSISNASPAVQP